MKHTQQLNMLLMQQLSNVVTLYNAAAGFCGKHIAILDNARSIVDDDVLFTVEYAERIRGFDGLDDIECYNIAELRDDSDVAEVIRFVTNMTIELAL